MAAVFGKIEEFDSEKEDWPNYVERLSHFFTANSITTDEQKLAVFLSVIGPATYKLLRNLVAPKKPGEKSFDDLVQLLTITTRLLQKSCNVSSFMAGSESRESRWQLTSPSCVLWPNSRNNARGHVQLVSVGRQDRCHTTTPISRDEVDAQASHRAFSRAGDRRSECSDAEKS